MQQQSQYQSGLFCFPIVPLPLQILPPLCYDKDSFISSIIGGLPGPAGPAGPPGPPGPTSTSNYADLYALMPPDNTATIAVDADDEFPSDGPSSSTKITRVSPSSFNLASVGSYLIQFQVSVSEAGKLILTLNGVLMWLIPFLVVLPEPIKLLEW
jgi:hypothetical protein